MSAFDNRNIFVLYGSQTGNAESIAKDLHQTIASRVGNVPSECATLNSVKGKKYPDNSLLIIVVSTTGNGDSPENADGWWRSVKLRSAAKDLFAGIKYVVLGLGDTNYDKFCYMGKAIDKRLSELGAERLLPLSCADEGTGVMEEVIEKWKSAVLGELLLSYLSQKAEGDSSTDKETTAVAEHQGSDETKGNAAIEESSTISAAAVESLSDAASLSLSLSLSAETTGQQQKEQRSASELFSTWLQQPLPLGLQSLDAIIANLGLESELLSSLSSSAPAAAVVPSAPVTIVITETPASGADTPDHQAQVLPSAVSSLSPLCRCSQPSSQSQLQSEQSQGQGLSLEHPFAASILHARWLSNPEHSQRVGLDELQSITGHHDNNSSKDSKDSEWGGARRVILLRLSLAGCPAISDSYQPGDSIGILCPNPPSAVQAVLDRIDLSPSAMITDTTNTTDSSSAMTLRQWLTWKVDLCGAIKRTQVTALAHILSSIPGYEQAARGLAYLTGRGQGPRKAWRSFVEEQALGMADLLSLVMPVSMTSTSTGGKKLSAMTVLSLLLPLPPRLLSVCCSPLDPEQQESTAVGGPFVEVALSVHRYTIITSGTHMIKRGGLGTACFLEPLLLPWLYPSSSPSSASASSPIVMKVGIFHRSAPNFHPPAALSVPLILIGPGTGVAPFRAFLQHRAALIHRGDSPSHVEEETEKETQAAAGRHESRHDSHSGCGEGLWRGGFELSAPIDEESPMAAFRRQQAMTAGQVHLFFGCRDSNDELFKEDWPCLQTKGALASVDIAYSRVMGAEKVYVTHRLRQRAAEMARLIAEQGAAVYICGDGNHMAKDVQQVLAEILCEHAGELLEVRSIEEAMQHLTHMKARKKLLLDIWSN